jgi:hypothetical protein
VLESPSTDAADASLFAGRSDRAPTELGPGSVVAGYRIDALLGSGGMGAVYRAYDDRTGRQVALKVLSSSLAASSSVEGERLEREIAILRRLRDDVANGETDSFRVVVAGDTGDGKAAFFEDFARLWDSAEPRESAVQAYLGILSAAEVAGSALVDTRLRERAAALLRVQVSANPYSLFAVRVPRPSQASPGEASVLRLWINDLSRDGLVQFLNAILAAVSLALILLLSALAHVPAALGLTLLLIAVARRFGRRSEPDDALVSARESLSAVAGRRSKRH